MAEQHSMACPATLSRNPSRLSLLNADSIGALLCEPVNPLPPALNIEAVSSDRDRIDCSPLACAHAHLGQSETALLVRS